MRVIIFIVAAFFAVHVNAQGIKFEEGSWSEVKAKAKAANKPVFVDMYTSWCGPCKMMAKDIFPLPEVGDYFNQYFINFKIDAEKGEGKEIAAKYEVGGFPTFLFVNPDGTLIYRQMGGMSKEDFLMHASNARIEFNDPKPLAVWDKEYTSKKNDKEFIKKYLSKRQKKRLDNTGIVDQYVSLLSEEELLVKDNLSILLSDMNTNIDGPFFNFLIKNKQRVIEVMGWEDPSAYDNAIINYLWDAVGVAKKNKDEKLLNKAVGLRKQFTGVRFSDDIEMAEMQMEYYSAVKDEKELKNVLYLQSEALINYDTLLLQMKIIKAMKEFDEAVSSGKAGAMSEKDIQTNREFIPIMIKGQLSFHIRELADYAVKTINDPKVLADAIGWVDEASKVNHHFVNSELKAKLLSKLGRKQEALVEMKKAIEGYEAMVATSNIENATVKDRLETNYKLIEQGDKKLSL